MENGPKDAELNVMTQAPGIVSVSAQGIDLSEAALSQRPGTTRNFFSPHEVVAGWDGEVLVHIDSQVVLPSDVLAPLVTHLLKDRDGTHVVISTASETDRLTGLDGVVRDGVEALTYTLSSLLPLQSGEECFVIALPENSPAVRVFSIKDCTAEGQVCTECAPSRYIAEAPALGACIAHLERTHSDAYMQKRAERELESLAAQWKECAEALSARFGACSQRYQEMLSGLPSAETSAAELERIERSLRELQLLRSVAQETSAAHEQSTQEHQNKLTGRRLAAALRSMRLSKPLGARAIERSRRTEGPRKRFEAEELKQAFLAVEADLMERLSDHGRTGSTLARALVETEQQVSRFAGALQDGDRVSELRSLIEREVIVEHERMRHAREIGRSDPCLGLRSLEQIQGRLSLLRQIVDISEWLDSDDSAEYAIQAAEMRALHDAGSRDGAELRSLEREFARVLDSTTPEEVRGGLIAFASVYRRQAVG